jgi:hypothetical protein
MREFLTRREKFLKRLAQLFAFFGASTVGESAAAKHKIDELLAHNGHTWHDVLELMQEAQLLLKKLEKKKKTDRSEGGDDQTVPNLFDLIYYTLERFLYLRRHELVAITLWVLHTFVFDRFMFTPRLMLLSPVRGCGKTTALGLLSRLCCRAERCDHITPAALYRTIANYPPTLLVDEADNMELTSPGPLRSVLNSGHSLDGTISRVQKGATRRFSTFAPVAIAAIGTLPLPLQHRSIVIHMARAPRDTELKRFDLKNDGQMEDFSNIYRLTDAWSYQCTLDPDPPMPKALHNRRADNWRILLSIADACERGDIAREAAITMSRDHQDEDAAIELLTDLRRIFDASGVDRLASAEIVLELNSITDAMWAEWRGDRGDQPARKLSPAELSRMLRRFRITPRSVWPLGPRAGATSAKGYYRHQFVSAWTSYCGFEDEAGTPAQPNKISRLRQV